jgi:hypothetical protein
MVGSLAANLGLRRPLAASRRGGLPPGVRQADCDGPFDEPRSGQPLWGACNASQQESIAMRFADDRADDVRDAVLRLQDQRPAAATQSGGGLSLDQLRAQALGQALWPIWTTYRDRAVNDLYRQGSINP